MLKKIAAGVAGVAIAAAAAALAIAGDITGAGATFPKPIYLKWAYAYKATGNNVNYQGIGSGAGIKQIEAGTVDFGASDKPLMPADLAANGLQQFPTVIGGVVPVVNLKGIAPGQMKLTGPVLAEIYLGKIVFWDDPQLRALNPTLKLPHEKVTVVHRADGSGTTFIFTKYLSAISPAWAGGPKADDAINWPTGVGGKGNDGVSAATAATNGAIGYVEYWYAVQNKLTYAVMQNKAGRWISPTAGAFSAAASGANWAGAPGFYLLLINEPAPGAWPISGATFILVHKKQSNAQTGHDVLAFFDWAYKNGDAAASSLDFVPLPAALKAQVRRSWSTVVGPNGQPVYR
jgi:phosphate transport system substrate-binding protein